MKPTNKLRFVRRKVSRNDLEYPEQKFRLVLQQWWQDDTYWLDENGKRCDGSIWRDVPMEEEA